MEINKTKCKHCGLCEKSCLPKAVDHENYNFNLRRCNLCYHCLAICPYGAITEGPLPKKIGKIPTPEMFENLIYKRRSHRLFKNENVKKEAIDKILDLVRYTPTGTNTQKVYITVVSGREKIQMLSGLLMDRFIFLSGLLLNFFTRPLISLFLGKAKVQKLYGYKSYFLKYKNGQDVLTHNAPCVFIFHAPKSSSTPEEDCAIWSATTVLYAETLGLGTCYNGFITRGIKLNNKAKKYLCIPKGNKVYSSVLIGVPVLKYTRNVIRKPVKADFI